MRQTKKETARELVIPAECGRNCGLKELELVAVKVEKENRRSCDLVVCGADRRLKLKRLAVKTAEKHSTDAGVDIDPRI